MGILEAVKKVEKARARYEGLQEGRQEGLQEGRQEGLQEGAMKKSYEVVKNLILQLALPDEQIARLSGTSTEFVQNVRRELEEQSD